jgi:tRNA threonylcarbamoyladenosine biosynthesis protein TsaE
MRFNLSLQQIHIVVDFLKELINSRDIVVLLQGDLASGKTTFVKKYVNSIGLEDTVTSPTFSLQSVYSDKIYHYDIYNKTLSEFISLGLLEEFEKSGIHFVEWGDKKLKVILKEYGFDIITIQIEKTKDKREYIIES